MKKQGLPTPQEFSHRTRQGCIARMQQETFDLLVVGGGITGAAVARDATSRGLRVALVERCDFAYGTSSRSSKLVHGGLRYLQNLELNLVFEALAERAFLLKSSPDLVQPLRFYFPVYRRPQLLLLSAGLWLYDLLALFRAPGFHRRMGKKALLKDIPFLNAKGLVGGFHYYDASMWDDVLAIETMRSALQSGAAVANYVEACTPLWSESASGQEPQLTGFHVRDLENGQDWDLRARRVVLCVGPWVDELGSKLSADWSRWLTPSKGVHLVFKLSRIPVPGAVVMTHAQDGRIAFVIPRPDFGAGVVIVGTTDGPTGADPDQASITSNDVDYLMELLNQHFPDLKLVEADILSAYVGVRPLMNAAREASTAGSTRAKTGSSSVLQKVSREHHIDRGPGGSVIVAGGKYTTHRKMAGEIVDFVLQAWRTDSPHEVPSVQGAQIDAPLVPRLEPDAIDVLQRRARAAGLVDHALLRYGATALDWKADSAVDGFPFLYEQFKYALQHEMVLHLEDFYLRRVPLFMSLKNHGLECVNPLLKIMAQERSWSPEQCEVERERLVDALKKADFRK